MIFIGHYMSGIVLNLHSHLVLTIIILLSKKNDAHPRSHSMMGQGKENLLLITIPQAL